jgi:hypothetical protein
MGGELRISFRVEPKGIFAVFSRNHNNWMLAAVALSFILSEPLTVQGQTEAVDQLAELRREADDLKKTESWRKLPQATREFLEKTRSVFGEACGKRFSWPERKPSCLHSGKCPIVSRRN